MKPEDTNKQEINVIYTQLVQKPEIYVALSHAAITKMIVSAKRKSMMLTIEDVRDRKCYSMWPDAIFLIAPMEP